jgi:hypothetical protein
VWSIHRVGGGKGDVLFDKVKQVEHFRRLYPIQRSHDLLGHDPVHGIETGSREKGRMQGFVVRDGVAPVAFIAVGVCVQNIVCRFARSAHIHGELGLQGRECQNFVLTLHGWDERRLVDDVQPRSRQTDCADW